ncbi:MAG TPA: dTDP-4-dehydrorhamnose 3,5-epimerase [Polyangia bacterium]|nr:dTDP-4-dehydrorhamnose 3,5-epimerase [Polyangia bacterium]
MSTSSVEPLDAVAGAYVVHLRQFGDERGHFFETYRRGWIPGAREMVQGNCSFSKAGVLRGLHYHFKQADLWVVPKGRVRAALYDLRRGSPTRGRNQVIEMGDDNLVAVYVPKGVAHGFYALTDTVMTYLVDELYDNSDELGVRWDDPALGIAWQVRDPILSARDRANPLLAELPAGAFPP